MDEFVIALLVILYVIAANCGCLGCVAVQWIGNVAEEPAAFIFRVEVSSTLFSPKHLHMSSKLYGVALEDDKVYVQPLGN
jgi:hypothetical protein